MSDTDNEKPGGKLDTGMLLLDPNGPTVYMAASKSTVIAHHGTFSEKATLSKPGVIPPGWKLINNRALAIELMEKLSELEKPGQKDQDAPVA